MCQSNLRFSNFECSISGSHCALLKDALLLNQSSSCSKLERMKPLSLTNLRLEDFNVPVIFSFLTGLAILIAKTRFIHRTLKANTDVSVFNHSIAICFALSGETLTFSTRKGESFNRMFSLQVSEALSASRPLFG